MERSYTGMYKVKQHQSRYQLNDSPPAPRIQGVKKRARDLENKTREAERERSELERELAHLKSVKQICDGVAPESPI